MTATRALVEAALRVRLAQDCVNVQTVPATVVEGLLFAGKGTLGNAVTGAGGTDLQQGGATNFCPLLPVSLRFLGSAIACQPRNLSAPL